jgi:hypothetical protein
MRLKVDLRSRRRRGYKEQWSLVGAFGGSEDIGVGHLDQPFEKDKVNQMGRWVSSQDSQPMHHRFNGNLLCNEIIKYLEVKKTLLHLSFIRESFSYPVSGWSTKLDISMPLKVEFCEAAHITTSINMNRKFPEKVDDGWCTVG